MGIQYAVPIIFSMVVLRIFAPELNTAFGMLIPAGFQGGHGTAAALGQTLGNLGWEDATDLAMTSATVGILTGIFGGIALIKIGTTKNYTKYVKRLQPASGRYENRTNRRRPQAGSGR